jgi:hypothetical protein
VEGNPQEPRGIRDNKAVWFQRTFSKGAPANRSVRREVANDNSVMFEKRHERKMKP